MRIVSVRLFLLCGLAACVTIPIRHPVTMEDVQARFTGIDEQGVNVEFRFTLHNPVSYELAPPRLRYEMDVNGDSYLSGEKRFEKSLIPDRDNVLVLPLRVSYAEIRGGRGRGEATFRLRADVFVPHGSETLELSVARAGAVPVHRPPEFEITGMDTFDYRNGFTSVRARVAVRNPGGISLDIGSLRYWIVLPDTVVGPLVATAAQSINAAARGHILAEGGFRSGNPVLNRIGMRLVKSARLRVEGTLETDYGSIPLKRH